MEVIYAYTRKQALEDGVLIDVTQLAKEAGIRYPTAVTAEVWNRYVVVPDGVSDQDEAGRLWDIVWMLAWRIRGSRSKRGELHLQLYVRHGEREMELAKLKAVCGPGDKGEPVITIMLPHED